MLVDEIDGNHMRQLVQLLYVGKINVQAGKHVVDIMELFGKSRFKLVPKKINR